MRIGINGFGRMGRLAVRALRGRPGLDLVHVNEPNTDAAGAAHLLEFDTVHGRFDADIRAGDDAVVLDGRTIGYSSADRPEIVDWEASGVDLVLECSGQFRTVDALVPYFDRGWRRSSWRPRFGPPATSRC